MQVFFWKENDQNTCDFEILFRKNVRRKLSASVCSLKTKDYEKKKT